MTYAILAGTQNLGSLVASVIGQWATDMYHLKGCDFEHFGRSFSVTWRCRCFVCRSRSLCCPIPPLSRRRPDKSSFSWMAESSVPLFFSRRFKLGACPNLKSCVRQNVVLHVSFDIDPCRSLFRECFKVPRTSVPTLKEWSTSDPDSPFRHEKYNPWGPRQDPAVPAETEPHPRGEAHPPTRSGRPFSLCHGRCRFNGRPGCPPRTWLPPALSCNACRAPFAICRTQRGRRSFRELR